MLRSCAGTICTLLFSLTLTLPADAMYESPGQVMARARRAQEGYVRSEACVASGCIGTGLCCCLGAGFCKSAVPVVLGFVCLAYGLDKHLFPARKPCVGLSDLCNYLCRVEPHVHEHASSENLQQALIYLDDAQRELKGIAAHGDAGQIEKQDIADARRQCNRLRSEVVEILRYRAWHEAEPGGARRATME